MRQSQRRKRRLRGLWTITGILLIVLMSIKEAEGSSPVIWEQKSQAHFQNGKPTCISIDSRGFLSLSPALDPVYNVSEPLIWRLASDSKGHVYAGTGNDGRLFRIDPNGNGVVFFDAEELEIRSVVVHPSGHIYAATFPDGKIYRLTADGQASVFFDPNASSASDSSVSPVRYIWSMALDKTGNLYAGTGEQGRIYRIDPRGRVSVFAETGETHVVALAMDREDRLIAGTDPNGRIYRIDQSGKISVIYDSPYQEIHTLLIDDTGNIYAGAMNEPHMSPRQPPVQMTSSETSANAASGGMDGGVIEVTAAAPTNAGGSGRSVSRSGGGAVYRIYPDGRTQEWWSSRSDVCMALHLMDDGTLLVGSGPRGALYAVQENNRITTLARIPEAQITGFVRLPSRQIMMASSNLGKIYRMGLHPAPEGVFESEIRDTGGSSVWGRLRWSGETPSGTSARFYVRSGNTDQPDDTWSAWTGPYTRQEGEAITAPSARYVQWKATLSTTNGQTPQVSMVSIAYLPRNIAPTIHAVTVYEPGIYFRDSGNPEPEEQDIPPAIADQLGNRADNGRGRSSMMGLPSYRRGMRTVIFDAGDDNDDALRYAVYFRGGGEKEWKLLKDRLTGSSYSWDAETFPDGAYTVRVVASDAPSNPQNLALETAMESLPFLVDHSGPAVEGLTVERRLLRFTVRDAHSPLYRVEYAVDGGDWWTVYPVDGVVDSREETFEIALTGLAPGEHVVAIRARDVSNNTGTGKQRIIAP